MIASFKSKRLLPHRCRRDRTSGPDRVRGHIPRSTLMQKARKTNCAAKAASCSATSICSAGRDDQETNSGIGVNGFLWRASLDTLSFLPLSSADPFGGVIITDWYAPPESPAERFKVTVYILGRELRSDGVRVAVFRQKRDTRFGMDQTPMPGKNTSTSLENAILTRARELRISNPGE